MDMNNSINYKLDVLKVQPLSTLVCLIKLVKSINFNYMDFINKFWFIDLSESGDDTLFIDRKTE